MPIVTQLPDAQSIHYSWLIYQANLPYVSTQDTKFEASKAYFARIIAGHSFCKRIYATLLHLKNDVLNLVETI